MPKGAARDGGSGLTVRVDGLTELLRDLKKLEPEVSKELRDRLKEIVNVVASDARQKAPYKTGKLAKKIVPSVTNKGAAVLSKAEHARIMEFGGRHPVFGNRNTWVFQPARPHVFPAVEAHRADVDRQGQEALDNALRKIGFS
jgi:HK97 gp10 family phage protein